MSIKPLVSACRHAGKSRRSNESFLVYLLRGGFISQDQLQVAEKSLSPSTSVFDVLVRLHFVEPSVLQKVWWDFSGAHTDDDASKEEFLVNWSSHEDFDDQWPKFMAVRFTCIVTFPNLQGQRFAFTTDPDNLWIKDSLKHYFSEPVHMSMATFQDISAVMGHLYGQEASLDKELESLNQESSLEQYAHIPFIESILEHAVRLEVTDVHFLPQDGYIRLSYRQDGLLRPVRSFHSKFWQMLVGKLKVMANLNLAEIRLPQSGRFTIDYRNRLVDCRLSTQPTCHGESIVIRLLDKVAVVPKLGNLGFDSRFEQTLKGMATMPHGLFLVVGPTGSGKTTTLHAVLDEMASPSLKIMTLEQPVEYMHPNICQTEIIEDGPLDFAAGVRSLLRQDPDILLVGEIRDEETAAMAVRAALTGHLVLSTMHSPNASSAFNRLRQLGVDRDLIESTLRGILNQRLIRKLCVCQGAGCEICLFTGYKGRQALGELHVFEASQPQPVSLSLEEGAQRLVENNLTTNEEVYRVLGKKLFISDR